MTDGESTIDSRDNATRSVLAQNAVHFALTFPGLLPVPRSSFIASCVRSSTPLKPLAFGAQNPEWRPSPLPTRPSTSPQLSPHRHPI